MSAAADKPRRAIPPKDLKLLWGLAAARCAYPGCRCECVVEATASDRAATIGKIAHVVAHADDGPRADPSVPRSERDRYENWILLCANHHDEVDGQPNAFTVETLQRWKSEHERWVRTMLTQAVPEVTSAELEVVCSALLGQPMASAIDFSVTAPARKMAKNNLTNRVTHLIRIGMVASVEVSTFLEAMSDLDLGFAERLKAGFVELYRKLQQEGYEGDSLFEAMSERVSDSRDFKKKAAAIAVLTYMFEACEIFER